MQDISQQMNISDTAPEEASQNISASKFYDINPDSYAQPEYKAELDPAYDNLFTETKATPAVAEYAKQSSQHSSLIKEDTSKFSTIERMWKYTKDQWSGVNSQEELNDLALKKIDDPVNFTKEDDVKLQEKIDDRNKYSDDYDLNLLEKVPGYASGFLSNAITSSKKHATEIGMATGLSSTIPAVGTVAGFSTAITGAMIQDGYRTSKVNAYLEFSKIKNQDGTDKFDDETKKNYATGVALATATIDTAVGALQLRNIFKPSQFITGKASEVMKRAVLNLGENTLLGAGQGGINATVETFSNSLAKYYDGTGESFALAVDDTVAQKGKIADAAANSAAAGFSMTFPFTLHEALKANRMSKTYVPPSERDVTPLQIGGGDKPSTVPNNPEPFRTPPGGPTEIDIIKALHFDETLSDLVNESKSTKVNELNPEENQKIHEQINKSVGNDNFYVDPDEAAAWAKTSDKQATVEKLFGIDDKVKNVLLKAEPHEFLPLIEKYPDLSEIVRPTPESLSKQQASAWLVKYQQQKANAEALKTQGKGELTPEDKSALAAVEKDPTSYDVFKEEDYLKQPVMSDALMKSMPEKEAQSFMRAQAEARIKVATDIEHAGHFEMNEVKDVVTRIAEDAERENALTALQNDPKVRVVENFFNSSKVENPKSIFPNHTEGYPLFAMDKKYLTGELEKYAKDPNLKGKKVFMKDGLTPDEAAKWLNISSGKELLETLSGTKRLEDLANERVASNHDQIAKEASDSVDLNDSQIAKAYEKNSKLHLEELNFIIDNKWSTFSKSIKRTAFIKKKPIEVFQNRAKSIVAGTLIKDLKPPVFMRAELKSQKKAMDALLKNEIPRYVENKEAAILNSQLVKESKIKVAEVNRANKFIKNLDIDKLKKAGPTYHDAAMEILDVYNMDPRKKGQSVPDSYVKFQESVAKDGIAIYEIPDEFKKPKFSSNELTVDQYLSLTDKLREIDKLAKLKNKLFTNSKKAGELEDTLDVYNKLHNRVLQNISYDPKRVEETKKQPHMLDLIEKGSQLFTEFSFLLGRAQHEILKLDNLDPNGPHNKYLWQWMKNSEFHKREDLINFGKHFEELGEKTYGSKKAFDKLSTTIIPEIPEFKGFMSLHDGKNFTQLDLISINLNRGNEGNLKVMDNFGVSRETMTKVLERHLTREDMLLTQRLWDVFKSYEPKLKEHQLRVRGKEFRLVKASEVVFKNEVFPGGYYPIHTARNELKFETKKLTNIASDLADLMKYSQIEAMTEDGHFIERVKSNDALLDLNFNRFFNSIHQMVHDLHVAEPLQNAVKIMGNKQIRDDMVSTIGIDGYKTIAASFIAHASSASRDGSSNLPGTIRSLNNHVSNGVATTAIVGKWTSIVIQSSALPAAQLRMGTSGIKHILETIRVMSTNPLHIPEMIELGGTIHPELRSSLANLEGNSSQYFHDLFPKGEIDLKNPIQALTLSNKRVNDLIVKWGYGALNQVDTLMKTIVALSSYRQALAGDVVTIKAGDYAEAVKYASNITELTQTHNQPRHLSEVQRMEELRTFTRFFNDMNILYNNLNVTGRRIRQDLLINKEDIKRISQANKDIKTDINFFRRRGAKTLAGAVLTAVTLRILEDMVRGNNIPVINEKDGGDQTIANYLMTTPIAIIGQSLPIVNSVIWASQQTWMRGRKTVETPAGKVLTDASTVISAVVAKVSGDKEEFNKSDTAALWHLIGVLSNKPTDSLFKMYKSETFQDMISKMTPDQVQEAQGLGAPTELFKELSSTGKENKSEQELFKDLR